MNAARYLIVKYIPDLRRVEPRNIGIVLWSSAGVAARFLAEKPNRPGEVDGRSIPSFVTSTAAYKQWVEFWRGELEKPEIQSVTRPEVKAARSSPEFLDVLMESGKGNFVLADGGFLLDAVDDPEDALDSLAATLIESSLQDESRDRGLDDVCDRLIEETNLRQDPNFQTGVVIECAIKPNLNERFEFSHAYRNGSLKRLYQRVPLARKRTFQRKTVHDAAWMFDRVLQSGIIAKRDAVSLVYLPTDSSAQAEAARWVEVLGTVSRVIDVSDESAALREFVELPTSINHP